MNDETGALPTHADDVHGATVGMRFVVLFGAFCFVLGFAIGGFTLPYLRFHPTTDDLKSKAETGIVRNALMVSIGPQTVWASPIVGTDAISTGLSVEQILSEYEVMASQAGLLTHLEFERVNGTVEARFSFTERDKKQNEGILVSAAAKDFPRALVIIFEASTTPGAIILKKIRADGKEKSTGATFVDLVGFGGKAPELAQGQHLTRNGVFEIRSIENGVAAFIDNKQVYPALVQKPLLQLPAKDDEAHTAETAPQILRLVGFAPDNSLFRDRLILVESEVAGADCTSRGIVIDVPRDKINVFEHMLKQPVIGFRNGKNAIIFNGFCETNAQSATNDARAAKTLSSDYHIEATFNLLSGAISYARIINQAAILAPTASPSDWRSTSPTRIASPLSAGGAMISVSCRPGGGASISVAGIPAPADLQSARISFDTSSGSAGAGMRWLANANSYEINEASRPAETRNILRVLRASGIVTLTGAGDRNSVSSPGSARIDAIRAVCAPTQIRQATTAPIVRETEKAPKPKAQAPNAPSNQVPAFKPAPVAQAPAPKAPEPKVPAAKAARKSEAQSVDAPSKPGPITRPKG